MQPPCHSLSVTKLVRALALANAQAGWLSEKGFMQTRCYGQSVIKLVRALALANAQAGWLSEKDRHAARLVCNKTSCANRILKARQRRAAYSNIIYPI